MKPPRLTLLRLTLSGIAGFAATLIMYSVFFVHGNVGGVMQYLHLRAANRRFSHSGASVAAIAQSKENLHAFGAQVGDPAFAAQMIPVALLVGFGVGLLVWRIFAHKVGQEARPDIQERMVYRLAYRKGGRFTLSDLSADSPLNETQAQAVVQKMLALGRLNRDLSQDDEGFTLQGR